VRFRYVPSPVQLVIVGTLGREGREEWCGYSEVFVW
jgi:hypothetical protein